mmetsp:Transcript_35850/g.75441  ORF Transcript_35850/g.75441 Transcript_35850/m.75441 type:complete len:236 (+) Transcript_35850:904-1611(+)
MMQWKLFLRPTFLSTFLHLRIHHRELHLRRIDWDPCYQPRESRLHCRPHFPLRHLHCWLEHHCICIVQFSRVCAKGSNWCPPHYDSMLPPIPEPLLKNKPNLQDNPPTFHLHHLTHLKRRRHSSSSGTIGPPNHSHPMKQPVVSGSYSAGSGQSCLPETPTTNAVHWLASTDQCKPVPSEIQIGHAVFFSKSDVCSAVLSPERYHTPFHRPHCCSCCCHHCANNHRILFVKYNPS